MNTCAHLRSWSRDLYTWFMAVLVIVMIHTPSTIWIAPQYIILTDTIFILFISFCPWILIY